jgi:hypothetical protein
MTVEQMTSLELGRARTLLGFSSDTLAADLGLPPAIVAAWESGRDKIPAHIARDLRWRVAIAERRSALDASGLPECGWLLALEAEPEPTKLAAQTARLEKVIAHEQDCPVCLAREQYVSDHFPPMPPRPIAAPLRALRWVFAHAETLPRWAQPAVPTAMAFGAYSLFRIFFLLPRIVAQPRIGLLALGGLTLSMAIGGAFGAAYGLFRLMRERISSRRIA